MNTVNFDKRQSLNSSNSIATEKPHYFFIRGPIFDLNSNLKFKPAFLTKIFQGASLQLDVSLNFLINDSFVFVVAIRWGAVERVFAGFQITDGLYTRDGYDLETLNLPTTTQARRRYFCDLNCSVAYTA